MEKFNILILEDEIRNLIINSNCSIVEITMMLQILKLEFDKMLEIYFQQAQKENEELINQNEEESINE